MTIVAYKVGRLITLVAYKMFRSVAYRVCRVAIRPDPDPQSSSRRMFVAILGHKLFIFISVQPFLNKNKL